MQNGLTNKSACLTRTDTRAAAALPAAKMYRQWFFWCFLLIPVLAIAGWIEYASFAVSHGPSPLLELIGLQQPQHWRDWLMYYTWLQFIWIPANMVLFLIWCALGVSVWDCKREQR